MENIRPSIEEVAKKVASQFLGDESQRLTDLVISAAKDAGMTSKQASSLAWLTNRHAFAGRMAKGASDEFSLADPGVVKLALQGAQEEEALAEQAVTMMPTSTNAQVTGQSASRVAPMEMGPFVVTKLKGADRDLNNEEGGIKSKLRRIIERLHHLMGGVQKVALQETPFFEEKLASLPDEAAWLIRATIETKPVEKVAFLADSPTGRALVASRKQDLEEVVKLATEAAELRKRAKDIAADRASIQEQIAIIRKEGLTR